MIPTKPYKFIVALVGFLASLLAIVLGFADVLPPQWAGILALVAQGLAAIGVWLKANPPVDPPVVQEKGTRVG